MNKLEEFRSTRGCWVVELPFDHSPLNTPTSLLVKRGRAVVLQEGETPTAGRDGKSLHRSISFYGDSPGDVIATAPAIGEMDEGGYVATGAACTEPAPKQLPALQLQPPPWTPPEGWATFNSTAAAAPSAEQPPQKKQKKQEKQEKPARKRRQIVESGADSTTEGEAEKDSSGDEAAPKAAPKAQAAPKAKAAPKAQAAPQVKKVKKLQQLVGTDGELCLWPAVGMKVKARWQAPPKPPPSVGALEAGKYSGGTISGVDLEHRCANITYNDGMTESAVLFSDIRLWA